ncbi:WD domain, G-beta repeat protein [Teladorsagia circumcincta]|uniref:Elongator complex protein 2 n=1 Tax=Teladorsagia circumcincta TaxID=45464 RepID=A0A2G9UQD9_TELCI|nr:WD domain, G-beta repeat protein [Teladorsagia circumcincta]
MVEIVLEEEFSSAGVNPRSHCLDACQTTDHFVFASDGQVVLQTFPGSSSGHVVSVSDRHHKGPITILKRVATSVLHRDREGINGAVGTLCGTASVERITVAASWIDNSKSGVRVWWLDRINNDLSLNHVFEIDDLGTVFAVAADMQVLSNESYPILLATAGQDSYVKLWRIENETEKTDIDELNVTKNSFKIAGADGGKIFNFGFQLVRLGIVGGQAAGFFGAAFSPDARQVVASSYFGGLYAWLANEELDVWDAAAVCSGHVGAVRDVAWHPCGRMLISVGEDKTTRIYITQKIFGECVFPSYGARVPALGLSNKAIEDSEVSQVESDGDAHWEEGAFQAAPVELHTPPTEDCLQQNTLWPEIQKLYGHGYEVYAIAVNPAGTVLATSCKASQADDAAIALWDTLDWSKKSEVHVNGFCYEKLWSSNKEHSRIIWSCCWFEDSQHFVTASRDMQVIIWRCNDESTAPVCSFKCSQGVASVAVCCGTELRDAIIAAGLQDGSLVLLNLQENQLRPISQHFTPSLPVDSPITRLRVNPRNRHEMAVTGSDGKLRVLRLSVRNA